MHVFEVDSSAMKQVAYEKNKLELIVWMKDGNRIKYNDVPYEVYKGFMKAPSKGAYYNRMIRPHYLNFEYV